MMPPSAPALVVALDGPASSGKSSVGAAAAGRLGYRFCDTGLLYRAVTWLALQRGVVPSDADRIVALVDQVELAADAGGRLASVLVGGQDVTRLVHGPAVDGAVSAISRVASLRASLLQRQRSIAADGRIIMAGRDIGTVVLPNADLKLYLDASVDERTRRRIRERGLDPNGPEAEDIRMQLRRRDELDSTREVAPLRIAPGAVVIHSDGNLLETTVDLVVAAINDRAAIVGAGPAPRSGTGRVPSAS